MTRRAEGGRWSRSGLHSPSLLKILLRIGRTSYQLLFYFGMHSLDSLGLDEACDKEQISESRRGRGGGD